MVTKLLMLAAAMLFTAAGASADAYEPEMHRTGLSAIKSITITEQGARSSTAADFPYDCGEFVLRKHEVIRFIATSGAVASRDYHHLDWSPCYVAGNVTFKNGLSGSWFIHQLKAGSLKLSNGRTLYLYCPKCSAKAFPPDD